MIRITFHGHSCIQLETEGHSVIIDPFLNGNPAATAKPDEIKVHYVLLTHAHNDHFGDTDTISRNNEAPVLAIVELADYLQTQGLKTLDINMGGTVHLPFGKVKMVPAFHSSSLVTKEGQTLHMGSAAGLIIHFGDKVFYHAGDTCLFGDMKLIGDMYDIDVAFLPIGDHYTMGPDDAVIAAEWIQAKTIVPVHYNTFPLLNQNAEEFAARVEENGQHCLIMTPGETVGL
ncbi:metal-dependent hydrolase [Paenibacillus gansuensis]|uniref:UPF0173 metal-dependent hydrolase ACFSUF_11710 n=1 Tax=Paenibacillus gansuensis TaxID=306542 RepID=A0ABW5PCL7_9BACL